MSMTLSFLFFGNFDNFDILQTRMIIGFTGLGVAVFGLVSIKPIVVTRKNPWQASTYNKKTKGARRCLTEVEVGL